MGKRSLSQSEKVVQVLDCLCQDIQNRAVPIPIPEVLTWALKRLFPEEAISTFVSEGKVFAINVHDFKVTWCVEESQAPVKINYWNAVWLQRKLTEYM